MWIHLPQDFHQNQHSAISIIFLFGTYFSAILVKHFDFHEIKRGTAISPIFAKIRPMDIMQGCEVKWKITTVTFHSFYVPYHST